MSKEPERRRNAIVAVAAVLAVVAAVRLFATSSPTASSPGAQSSASASAGTSPYAVGSATDAGYVPTPHPAGAPAGPKNPALADSARDALAHYLEFSVFPPWSRPADDSQKHLWEWTKVIPTGQAFTRDKQGKQISAELTLDRNYAAPGQAITATITIWRGGYDAANREPVDAKVTGAIEAYREPPPGAPVPEAVEPTDNVNFQPVASVAFAPLAGGPGQRYTATFVPSAIKALEAQLDVRFVALVDAAEHKFPFSQPFRYASKAPLVVLDGHADRVDEGSLVVSFAADVKQLGPVMVQATLFDAKGETPIAVYDDYYRPAQLGPQQIEITFFGKAIHDKGIDGPYTVRALHGYVRQEGAEPPEVFWESDKAIATAPYKATDFSSAEWDSPEKQAKINQYKQIIADNQP